jgi:FkbH-like protein
MIDDSPTERAAIEAGLPGVRLLGSHLYYLKRILLWSSETQQSVITSESSRRTELTHTQLRRELDRKKLSHKEFLHTLRLRVMLSVLQTTKNLHMNRALELFNKTNQFNTRGARYTLEQCHQHFIAGRKLFLVHAEDRFSQYGLIAAAWVHKNCIDHMVMSCRALGFGVEDALLAYVAHRLAQENAEVMLGHLQKTDVNVACRRLYGRNGFSQVEDNPVLWTRPLAVPVAVPLTSPS